jgi:2-phospho-L-lactate transferase/gluconeogenesis factor (CofD/UPF0052 family)
MTQPGETDGYSIKKHVQVIYNHIDGLHFDYVIVNDEPISEAQAENYAKEGAVQIGLYENDLEEFLTNTTIVKADLLDEGEKVRHDPHKLAKLIISCFSERPDLTKITYS